MGKGQQLRKQQKLEQDGNIVIKHVPSKPNKEKKKSKSFDSPLKTGSINSNDSNCPGNSDKLTDSKKTFETLDLDAVTLKAEAKEFAPLTSSNLEKKGNVDWFDNPNDCNNSRKSWNSISTNDNWRVEASAPRRSEPVKMDKVEKINLKEYLDRSNTKRDEEFDQFEEIVRRPEKVHFKKVKEIEQDLFQMDKSYSLAHCVAEDMGMGSGIAVQFRQQFKNIDSLLNQRVKQGGVAVLEEDRRHVFYLVTKKVSSGKPTYYTLWLALKKMREHIKADEVRKLAIPRIGCGLDKLDWAKVKIMLEFLFKNVDVEITVCNFQQVEEGSPKKLKHLKVVHNSSPLVSIDSYTLLLYFTDTKGDITKEMEELDSKFHFLDSFRKHNPKVKGTIIRYDRFKDFMLYGCVVRTSRKDFFDYVAFNKCLEQIRIYNKTDKYSYIAFQAFSDPKDEDVNLKILNLLQNASWNNIVEEVHVRWPGMMTSKMPESRGTSSFF